MVSDMYAISTPETSPNIQSARSSCSLILFCKTLQISRANDGFYSSLLDMSQISDWLILATLSVDQGTTSWEDANLSCLVVNDL